MSSASGGYLRADDDALYDLTLEQFLWQVPAGVLDIPDPDKNIRVLWAEGDVPTTPTAGSDWVGFGVSDVQPDGDPEQRALPGGGFEQVIYETLDVSYMFYGKNAAGNAARLRDAMRLDQNQDGLAAAGMAVAEFSAITHVAEQWNNRFFNRADITMTLRREVRRGYDVFDFVGASGVILANRGNSTLVRDWSAGGQG